MFCLPYGFFGSGSHTLHLPFRPYSLETTLTLECLLLGETCRSSFAFEEGPMPNLVLFAPWSDLFPNSALFPSIHSPWLKFPNFWLLFLQFVRDKSQISPLPAVLLSTLRRDLIILIERFTKHTIVCEHKAEILLSYEFNYPVFLTSLTISRTYFEINPPPISLGDHWLHLREQFDARQTRAPRWSLEVYLNNHANYHRRYCQRQQESSASSTCSDSLT